jgi:hypothetical protein
MAKTVHALDRAAGVIGGLITRTSLITPLTDLLLLYKVGLFVLQLLHKSS